jgi:ribosomal protein L19E
MTDLTPGEVVREFYRNQGKRQEKQRWLTAIAAVRERLNEMRFDDTAEPDIHKAYIEVAQTTLDNLERLTK